MYFPLSASVENVVLAYGTKSASLVSSQVVLIDHAVMYKVPSLVLAVIVFDCAGDVSGCVIEIVGAVLSNVTESLTIEDTLPAASLTFTYTVFDPSVSVHPSHVRRLKDEYVLA